MHLASFQGREKIVHVATSHGALCARTWGPMDYDALECPQDSDEDGDELAGGSGGPALCVLGGGDDGGVATHSSSTISSTGSQPLAAPPAPLVKPEGLRTASLLHARLRSRSVTSAGGSDDSMRGTATGAGAAPAADEHAADDERDDNDNDNDDNDNDDEEGRGRDNEAGGDRAGKDGGKDKGAASS
eukprot:Unigene9377_Nuclearia_a/m.28625 Unigene9377_Nuclearia_a/g.28625  ORF Unigene9377_Nuclearia_a/g.28625 Unigene9377_Nuclearia_a/m.28625 type:complete len:187 (-) Unigene9377_Nuclearia_a:170-730(-)